MFAGFSVTAPTLQTRESQCCVISFKLYCPNFERISEGKLSDYEFRVNIESRGCEVFATRNVCVG